MVTFGDLNRKDTNGNLIYTPEEKKIIDKKCNCSIRVEI